MICRPQLNSLHFVQDKFTGVVPLEKRDVLDVVKREVGVFGVPNRI